MTSRTFLATLILSVAVQAQSSPSGIATQPISSSQHIAQKYGRLPLTFEANQGQTDPKVKFLSRGSGYTLFLTSDEAVFSLRRGANEWPGDPHHGHPRPPVSTSFDVLRMKLHNANPSAKVTGVDEQPGRSNYFIGNDSKKWQSNVVTFAKVKYESVYPGIDLVYYGNERQLEYDFIVTPGADPSRILFDVTGSKGIRRDAAGDLVLETSDGEMRWHKPQVYQEESGKQHEIAAAYVVKHKNEVTFEIATYDRAKPLFIDPLIYSTYLGGSAEDFGRGIAVDGAGSAYVTGYTASTDFPTANALQTTSGGGSDVFVSKFNASGSALVYSTYLGGSDTDIGNGITVDSSGNAYVTGFTYSTNFPTKNPLQGSNGGAPDAFVTELDPSGAALVFSTYLGGGLTDAGQGIAVDNSGHVFVTGSTSSVDFPITIGALQTECGGVCSNNNPDAFVMQISSAGSALVYSTYLGGTNFDYGEGVAIDGSGNAYITGYTASTDFPLKNPVQALYGGGTADAFLAEVNSNGSALVYSTYLGGNDYDVGLGISVNTTGEAIAAGYTVSTNFPTVNPIQSANAGKGDGFITEVNSLGSAFVYSTYFGGSGEDACNGISLDNSNDVYVAGYTASSDFPVKNALQTVYGGGIADAFAAEINASGTAIVYSTFVGGSDYDDAYGVAVDVSGNVYMTGFTLSTNFPTMHPLQATNGGAYDAYVAQIAEQEPTPTVVLVPPTLSFGNQTVGITSGALVSSLTNTGSATLTITSIAISGLNSSNFAETNTCGATLNIGATCTISVTFAPTQTGIRTAAVSVMDNAPGSPQTVPLSGTGVRPAVALSPVTLTFPTTVVFSSSPTQNVTLTNTGLGLLTISNIAATSPFLQTNTCGTSVAPGASCTLSVRFKPSTKGQVTGSISIADNAPGSPQRVKLTGVGTFIQANPTSENFGSQPVGTTSIARQVIVTNKGGSTVSISSIAITGTNAGDFAETNTCGTSLASGASCKIVVTFTPTAKGKRMASVAITDNGGGSPQSVALSGTGT